MLQYVVRQGVLVDVRHEFPLKLPLVELLVMHLGGVQQGRQVTLHCHHLDRLVDAGNLSSNSEFIVAASPSLYTNRACLGLAYRENWSRLHFSFHCVRLFSNPEDNILILVKIE